MNRKSLAKITNTDNFNQDLFTTAHTVVQNCQGIIRKSDGLNALEKTAIRDKQIQLETAIKNAISALGKFVGVHKTALGNPLDHSIDIFEAITDSIETSVQKYREASKNAKSAIVEKVKAKESIDSKNPKRPQQLYSFIKPANFDNHTHEKNLDFIRTDLHVIKSQSMEMPYDYVCTVPQLERMVEQLSRESEVAVDVEHSNKSYEGMTCLLQFSSRSKDYIVDVFPIWKEVPLLKKIMENESIIKVMHGAEMDTKWFQRDFNIHIINLFDTYRASRVLGFQKHSYAVLLNHYCEKSTDKTYQLADWRLRPLTQEMLHYARIDTHYLLEIFDKLRADMHQKALNMSQDPEEVIRNVYAASYLVTKNEVQLFDFRKKEFYLQLKKDLKEKDFLLFELVFKILDDVARQNDLAFEEIVNYKVERQVISKLRELLYHRGNDNIKTKIDRFILNLREVEQNGFLAAYLPRIKTELQEYFASIQKEKDNDIQNKKNKKSMKLASHLQTFENYDNTPKVEAPKSKISISFSQYPQKTYECLNVNPFTMLRFQPICAFLAKRAGVEQAREDDAQMDEEENDMAMDEQVEENEEEKVEDQQEDAGIIEFKRINPNVIYTIEEAAVVEEKHKPRKKRRETEYEQRVKSKESNIFELLED